ncbi:hypothetical protein MUK42_17995 [Musa troglodytarum]|uniref:Uncharacterized protein n=1 Tax=Musa troglodytarum TaxID=320322 RepID=A0A9E7L3U6_9LILI|nr:hypothetical protein MUK42_17995 [Musa troglodytarum]
MLPTTEKTSPPAAVPILASVFSLCRFKETLILFRRFRPIHGIRGRGSNRQGDVASSAAVPTRVSLRLSFVPIQETPDPLRVRRRNPGKGDPTAGYSPLPHRPLRSAEPATSSSLSFLPRSKKPLLPFCRLNRRRNVSFPPPRPPTPPTNPPRRCRNRRRSSPQRSTTVVGAHDTGATPANSVLPSPMPPPPARTSLSIATPVCAHQLYHPAACINWDEAFFLDGVAGTVILELGTLLSGCLLLETDGHEKHENRWI